MSNQLETIDPAALAQVSGGTTVATTTSTASNDQILTALNGILSSIQNLSQPQQGGLNQSEMLMFMMIMEQRNQQLAVAGAAASPWGWGQPPIYYY
jgi:hypothetical protein